LAVPYYNTHRTPLFSPFLSLLYFAGRRKQVMLVDHPGGDDGVTSNHAAEYHP
jgi:hypothetical protein